MLVSQKKMMERYTRIRQAWFERTGTLLTVEFIKKHYMNLRKELGGAFTPPYRQEPMV